MKDIPFSLLNELMTMIQATALPIRGKPNRGHSIFMLWKKCKRFLSQKSCIVSSSGSLEIDVNSQSFSITDSTDDIKLRQASFKHICSSLKEFSFTFVHQYLSQSNLPQNEQDALLDLYFDVVIAGVQFTDLVCKYHHS